MDAYVEEITQNKELNNQTVESFIEYMLKHYNPTSFWRRHNNGTWKSSEILELTMHAHDPSAIFYHDGNAIHKLTINFVNCQAFQVSKFIAHQLPLFTDGEK